LKRYEIHDGELYISIAGSIGFVGVYKPTGQAQTILTENAARIVINGEVVPGFLALFMNSWRVQKQILEAKGTGGGVPKLALFRIESLLMTMPMDKDEQLRITDKLQAANKAILIYQEVLQKLEGEKQGLMQDLLTGKKRVTPLLKLDLIR
jgi:type I restriction enzyme S subunit